MADERTTISVREQTLARFNDALSDINNERDSVPNHSADSFVSALLDTWAFVDDDYNDPSVEELTEVLKEELVVADNRGMELDTGRLFAAVETIEERTGRLEQMLEEMEGRHR